MPTRAPVCVRRVRRSLGKGNSSRPRGTSPIGFKERRASAARARSGRRVSARRSRPRRGTSRSLTGKTAERLDSHTARLHRRLDTPEERARDAQRFATAEPVFGTLRWNKQLDRVTLRGQRKVDGQWKLFCLIQHIEKLAHHGYAQAA